MTAIVLFGTGTSAQVMHYHLSREGHQVAAFTIDRPYLSQASLLGTPVLPFDEIVRHCPPAHFEMMIAIGYVQVNRLRAERCAQAQAMGYKLFSYISPSAIVWDGLNPGSHCRIGESSLLQPFTQLGDNVFIGSGCLIGHHSVLQDHCFLASRVTLGGGVIVEPYAFLGTGAIVRNKARIAARSVVGAGAVVLEDTRPGGVYTAPGAQDLQVTSEFLSPG